MKISTIAIGFFSAAFLCGQASAQQETDYGAGTRALPLQQAGGTARASAMGSAVVAVPEGAASVLWNPAALSRMNCKEVSFHTNEGLAGTSQEIAIFGTPLGRVKDGCQGGSWGGIAASLGYTSYGTFNGTDANGAATSNYGATGDINGSIGWGKEVLPGLSGGVTLKGDRSTFANQSYNSVAADLGLLWTVIPSVNLGVVYSNIGLSGGIGGAQPAAGWRIGAGWDVTKHWLLAASGELQDKAVNRFQLGTEYLIGNVENKANVLALRAGYDFNYPDAQLDGLMTSMTLGLGYTITKSLAIDYAMVPAGELGTSQKLSLTLKFGCPAEKKAAPVAAAPVAAAAAVVPVKRVAAAAPIVIKSIELADEHFDFDKSTLTSGGIATLRENIVILKENPNAHVRVSGYTSMSGTVDYNQKLSERRAKSVRDFLIKDGAIAPSRISTIGYGESRPAMYEPTPSDTHSSAAKSNMRVLFEMTVK